MQMNRENEQQGMEQYYRQTVEALIAAAGERDSIAEAHSERVRLYAEAIGRELGTLSEKERKDLGYAASLHDIGKIAISRRILNKLGKLTDEEFKIMRQHSLIAERILAKVDGLHDCIPMIRHHHERYDGTGYPDGLAGDDIPIGARIIAVAETYDILTSDVPWRPALSKDEALQEIERCAGTQFDPEVVKVLRKALENVNKPKS